jgi:hypothetical protein
MAMVAADDDLLCPDRRLGRPGAAGDNNSCPKNSRLPAPLHRVPALPAWFLFSSDFSFRVLFVKSTAAIRSGVHFS